jgi:hypothetical protein
VGLGRDKVSVGWTTLLWNVLVFPRWDMSSTPLSHIPGGWHVSHTPIVAMCSFAECLGWNAFYSWPSALLYVQDVTGHVEFEKCRNEVVVVSFERPNSSFRNIHTRSLTIRTHNHAPHIRICPSDINGNNTGSFLGNAETEWTVHIS